MTDAVPFLPGLSPVAGKSLTTSLDPGNLSSNGGLVLPREAARRLGLATVLADPLPDTRNPLLVIHSYRAMVTARMMAIAAGYEDADHLDALRHDLALLMACERAPESGRDLPNQPTISRLENVAEPWRERCRWRWKPSLGRVRRFHQFNYAAGSWSRERHGL